MDNRLQFLLLSLATFNATNRSIITVQLAFTLVKIIRSVLMLGASVPLGGEDIQQLNEKMETLQVFNPTESASKLDDDGVGRSVEKMNDSAIGL